MKLSPSVTFRVVAAWTLILVAMAVLAFAGRAAQARRAPAPSGGGEAALQFTLQAKYAAAMAGLVSMQPKPADAPVSGTPAPQSSQPQHAQLQQLFDALEKIAETPTQRLRLVPIAGALLGKSAALARLDARTADETAADAALAADAVALRGWYADGVIDAAGRVRLEARHGWFARLAFGAAAAPESPAWWSAYGAGLGVIALAVTGVVALAVGVVLLLLAARARRRGGLRAAHVPPKNADEGAAFIELFALYLASFIGFSLALSATGGGLFDSWWYVPVLLLVLLAIVRSGTAWATLRQGLGLHTGRGLLREIGAGVVGYVTGLPLIALGFIVTAMVTRAGGAPADHPLLHDAGGDALHTFALYALACGFAPLVEETMFRGALYHHVRGWAGIAFSAVLTALIFAAIHPQGLSGVPALMAIAIVLALLRAWRGSVVASMTAHALSNAVPVTLLLLAQI